MVLTKRAGILTDAAGKVIRDGKWPPAFHDPGTYVRPEPHQGESVPQAMLPSPCNGSVCAFIVRHEHALAHPSRILSRTGLVE
jgi:hypothetical protein